MPASPASVWKSAEQALIAGDVRELGRLLHEHAELFREADPPAYNSGGLSPDYAGGDPQAIIARNHDFDTWEEFAAHLDARTQPGSRVARFETAVDAIVNGDEVLLTRCIREDPGLVGARSTRRHHATLLNYVGANGVESHRQKTPKNAVQIAGILLDAGAGIDAAGDMYGGTTTLGLVATSIHPLNAGVQNALIDFLLARGASVERAVAPDYRGGNLVDACLANARPEAAAFLAGRGAPLTLAGAAGVGRLDTVERFFEKDGRLTSDVPQDQFGDAFAWACGGGHTAVVDFMLRHGMDPGARLPGDRQTGLHSAAVGGRADVVTLLLDRRAPVDVRDESYKSTPLGWALYGWSVTPPENDRERYYEVVTLLVGAGAAVEPDWLAWDLVAGDPRMLALLKRESPRP
jgi:hypothetical protein